MPINTLSREELDLVIEVFDYYVENKLEKDSQAISKYMEYAEKLGYVSSVGPKYDETKNFFNIKYSIREHITNQIKNVRQMRNKILENFTLQKKGG